MSDQAYIEFCRAGQTICGAVMVLSFYVAFRAIQTAFKEQD